MSFIISFMSRFIIPPPLPIIPWPPIMAAMAARISIFIPSVSSPTKPIIRLGRSLVAMDKTYETRLHRSLGESASAYEGIGVPLNPVLIVR